jgi:signal peptidase II
MQTDSPASTVDSANVAPAASVEMQAASNTIEPLAWRVPRAHLIFWSVAVSGLVLDLVSKEWIFHTLRQSRDVISVIPYVIDFQTMFNGGALFGIGQGQTTLFLTASIVALALVVWMFANSSGHKTALHVALAGILAGAMGNMYDRAFVRLVEYPLNSYRYYIREDLPDGRIRLTEYPRAADARQIDLDPSNASRIGPETGYVRDFIKISTAIRGRSIYPWIFNVADMLLVGGVGILALQLLLERRPVQPAAVEADHRPSPGA